MGEVSTKCKCPGIFSEIDRQNLRRKDFAARMGVSTGNVSDWASGRSTPTPESWAKAARVLGCTVQELKYPGILAGAKAICAVLAGEEKEKPASVSTGGLSPELVELLTLCASNPDLTSSLLALARQIQNGPAGPVSSAGE